MIKNTKHNTGFNSICFFLVYFLGAKSKLNKAPTFLENPFGLFENGCEFEKSSYSPSGLSENNKFEKVKFDLLKFAVVLNAIPPTLVSLTRGFHLERLGFLPLYSPVGDCTEQWISSIETEEIPAVSCNFRQTQPYETSLYQSKRISTQLVEVIH